MKTFNVLNNQQVISGLLMPKNCIYGHINLKYVQKIDTGKIRFVYDKNGYPVQGKNGERLTRKVWRNETRTQSVTYCVMDLKPISFENGKKYAFQAYIKTPEKDWHETILVRNAWMKELNNFISSRLQDYCKAHKTTLANMWLACNATPKVNMVHKMAIAATHRREVQKHDNMIFQGYKCYVLNPNIITDGVQVDPPVGKSVIATHKGAFNGLHGEAPARISGTGKKSFKMSGKDSGFRANVETPCGIIRFYNEQEYNAHIQAVH